MEIIERIKKSYKHCLDDDENISRSLHWEKRLSQVTPEKWFNEFKLSNFRSEKSQLSKGMDNAGTYKETLSAYRALKNLIDRETISDLSECIVGKPEVYKVDADHETNCSDLDLSYFCNKINTFLGKPPDIICEIGGGYGGLANKLKLTNHNSSIVLIDLPEAGILQTYYLNALYPQKNFFLYSDYKEFINGKCLTKNLLNKYDFIILPPWVADKLDDNTIDLFINTRSMMEMTTQSIEYYFKIINRTLMIDGVFYCVNRYEKTTVGYPVRIAEYPFDDYWVVLDSIPFWRKPHIHELLVSRSEFPSASMKNCLNKLPKRNPRKKPYLQILGIIKRVIRNIVPIRFSLS